MARVNRIEKCRKEQKCSKCGKTIEVGSSYLKATPFHRAPIIRCTDCGLRSWETSGSEYVLSVGQLVEFWEKDYGVSESTTQDLCDELQNIMDTCQESLDNMPYQLQDSDNGQLLQERIDCISDVISELEQIEYDSIKDDYIENNDITYNEEEDEYRDEDGMTVDIEEAVKDEYSEAINEALSSLEY